MLQEYACRDRDRLSTFLALLRDGLMLQGGKTPPARRAGHLLWGPWQRCSLPLCLHAGIAGLDNFNIHPAHLSSAELPICATSWTLTTPRHLSKSRYPAAHAWISIFQQDWRLPGQHLRVLLSCIMTCSMSRSIQLCGKSDREWILFTYRTSSVCAP